MPRKAIDLLGEVHQMLPHWTFCLALKFGQSCQLMADRAGHAAFRKPRKFIDGWRGQTKHFTEIAHGAAQVIRRKRAHQRGVLESITLVYLEDQLLANIACKVEVDIGDCLQVFIEKPSEKKPVAHRVHMAETNEITDDRADRRTPASARWQARTASDRTFTAHTLGNLGRLFLEVAVDEEKACQVVF